MRITSIGGWIANKLDVPHVWHIREYGEEDFNLYSIYNTNYMYRVMKNGEAMIAIADGIVDKFKPIFGEKVVKISNGINLERFINQKKEILNKDIITIGMTSIVSETKGQREFLYALSQIEKPIRDKLNIIIAGACYDEKYLDELNDIVVKGNMEKQVTMLGYVNNVETVLKQLDILVVASRAEAFGRVTVEGMAAGCLIIGANSGGTKEILENGKYGLLYDANNVLDLKEKILYAVNNNAEMRVVAKEAQKKSIEKYSEIRNAKEIEKLYKKLCGDKDD